MKSLTSTLYSIMARLVLAFALLGAVFVWGFAAAHYKVFPYTQLRALFRPGANATAYDRTANQADDRIWAERVIAGGYILHFRHAQREKWTDVTGFDAYELVQGIDAETSDFARATCLTERGKVEATLIGQVFRLTGVKIGQIVTSPSCRSRQTSRLAFGDVGRIENALLHRTAIRYDQHQEFGERLRAVIGGIAVEPGTNAVLSGHVGTLSVDADIVVDLNEVGDARILDLREEGGFVVLEKSGDTVIARHVFEAFSDFVNAAILLPAVAK